MVPEYKELPQERLEQEYVDRTYRLDLDRGRISGYVDGVEAVQQMVWKALMTERYETPIYLGQWGVELERLIGQDMDFAASDLSRAIEEALLADERVTAVDGFAVEAQGDTLRASFAVETDAGRLQEQKVVEL